MQLLGAATAAPRRFVACEAGVQVNGGSVGRTVVGLSNDGCRMVYVQSWISLRSYP
jgi:hypothetical protein